YRRRAPCERQHLWPARKWRETEKRRGLSAFNLPEILRRGESLPYQPAEQGLFPCLTIDFGERFGERDFLRAGFHAVLRVRAILDAAVAHRGLQTFFGVHSAGGVHIEKANLAEDCS